MFWLAAVSQTGFDMMRGHSAVTGIVVGFCLFDLVDHGAADFHRHFVEFTFYSVGTVMTRAAFNRHDLGVLNQLQHITCFQADILHALVTGYMVCNLAQRVFEICFEFVFLQSFIVPTLTQIGMSLH